MAFAACNSPEAKKTTAPTGAGSAPKTVLRVNKIPTEDGMLSDEEANAFKYPARISVDSAGDQANEIAAYGGAYKIWLGPKGWTGNAHAGADGNAVINLRPADTSTAHGQRATYYEVPACIGCMLLAAAPYFPAAMEEYNKEYNEDSSSHIEIPEGLQITRISETLISYTLPEKNGLITGGVAFYLPPGVAGDPYYTEAEFVLPRTKAGLLQFLSRNFIAKITHDVSTTDSATGQTAGGQ